MKHFVPIMTAVLFTLVFAAMKPADKPDDQTGAVTIHNSGCNLILANGSMGVLAANRDVRVYNSGRSLRICQGTIDNPSGRVIRFNAGNTGMHCAVIDGITDNWQETISASGQVTLQCRL